jgi:ATP-dependent RNA helicase DeaD
MEPKPPTDFSDLNISPEILRAVDDMGFEEPSPIQLQTIPTVMNGKDLVGQAQTGTGKTAAFAIPLLMRMQPRRGWPQILVMVPTRELAIQVAEEFNRIGKHTNTRVLPVYGGQNIIRQIKALQRGVDVIVGTPGRMLDHLSRKTLRLDHLQSIVLDEADEMLDMGFIGDIESILAATPSERQTLLFSATIPSPVVRLARKYMNNPARVSINPEHVTAPDIWQGYYDLRNQNKLEVLCRILDAEIIEKAIIFCRTKRGVSELFQALHSRGYLADQLHGDLDQNQRNRAMGSFRDGDTDLLVATDVAARGIDVQNISHVINYDCPQDPESYVHRIGRTGRAGRTGVAITLVHPKELPLLRTIQRLVKVRIERRPIPSPADVADRQMEIRQQHLLEALAAGNLAPYRNIIEKLSEDYDPTEVAAAALKLLVKDSRTSSPPSRSSADREERFGDTGAEDGMVRFFLNIGRKQSITPADIVRSVAEQAVISGGVIGAIDIYENFSFVEVPEEVAHQVFHAMRKSTIKGWNVNLEPARPR